MKIKAYKVNIHLNRGDQESVHVLLIGFGTLFATLIKAQLAMQFVFKSDHNHLFPSVVAVSLSRPRH